jgi:hypothetical protein
MDEPTASLGQQLGLAPGRISVLRRAGSGHRMCTSGRSIRPYDPKGRYFNVENQVSTSLRA